MEIVDMTFAGIPIGMLIAAAAAWYFVRNVWRERRQDLADIIKKIEDASKKFNEEHEWKPRTINGVDCGEWVSKKDGRSLGNLGYEVGLD